MPNADVLVIVQMAKFGMPVTAATVHSTLAGSGYQAGRFAARSSAIQSQPACQ
jgi:hypothetical protein